MQYQVVSFNYWGHRVENYSGSDETAANEAYARYSRCALNGDIALAGLVVDGETVRYASEEDGEIEVSKVEEAVEEVVVVEEPQATLITVYNNSSKGSIVRSEAKALEPGQTTDRYFGRFDLESDAWEMLMDKYPVRKIVHHQEMLDEQERRLNAQGTSFAQQALLNR